MGKLNFEEVVKYFRSGALLLRFAIDSETFPDSLLHTFACDCAQRSLMWERKAGIDSDKSTWKATGIKRLWIEEKKTNKELVDIHKQVRKIAEETDSSAAWAAAWASSDHPLLAARCAAHYGSAVPKKAGQEGPVSYDWNAEKLWQKDRLLWLLELWDEHGEKSPELLREGNLPSPEPPHIALNAGIENEFSP